MCSKKEPRDIANISGKYLPDITDWIYLCRGCHMIFDQHGHKDMSDRICIKCGSNESRRRDWANTTDGWICKRCNDHEYYIRNKEKFLIRAKAQKMRKKLIKRIVRAL